MFESLLIKVGLILIAYVLIEIKCRKSSVSETELDEKDIFIKLCLPPRDYE